MELPDDAIVQRVQAGHTRDYEILIRRYQTALVRFLTHFTGDRDDGESLAQDAFIRVYESLDRYRPEGRFKALLFKTARNLAINHIKHRQRQVPLSGFMSTRMEHEHFSSTRTPEAHLESRHREQRLEEALRRLPHNQRLALVLKVFLQYSYQQIRDVTGWSIPKIETLISRGRSRLARIVNAQDSGHRPVDKLEDRDEVSKRP